MDLMEQAFKGLWPEKEFNLIWTLRYSDAFSTFNANVRYTKKSLNFKLSMEWKEVSDEIKIGLIQSLMIKVFKDKGKKTTNIDLYNLFIKNVHISAPKTDIDPVLSESFDRVNDKYFAGMMEKTNLILGNHNFSKLGTYEYGSDTITISTVLLKDESLLDYVMYHEMLHKKLKFTSGAQRNLHHSREFRSKEKEWEDKEAEIKLKNFLRSQKRKSFFKFW